MLKLNYKSWRYPSTLKNKNVINIRHVKTIVLYVVWHFICNKLGWQHLDN